MSRRRKKMQRRHRSRDVSIDGERIYTGLRIAAVTNVPARELQERAELLDHLFLRFFALRDFAQRHDAEGKAPEVHAQFVGDAAAQRQTDSVDVDGGVREDGAEAGEVALGARGAGCGGGDVELLLLLLRHAFRRGNSNGVEGIWLIYCCCC